MAVLGLGSCAGEIDPSRESAIWTAQMAIDEGDCQGALDALAEADDAPFDAEWLQAKASVYTCFGHFNLSDFFENDIPKLTQLSGIGGVTLFSSSHMASSTDADYVNLQKAIDTLLYPGDFPLDEDPTPAQRKALFSAAKAGDLHGMLMYLLLGNLGKYMAYYGNTDAAGTKGAGPAGNTCFVNYDLEQVIEGDFSPLAGGVPLPVQITLGDFFSAGITGACTGTNGGDLTVAQMCQGVVLFNNFMEVFSAVVDDLKTDDWDKIVSIKNRIAQVRGIITSPDMTIAESVLSQTKCQTAFAANTDALKVFFAIYMETLLR
jgi:hypothetical protein